MVIKVSLNESNQKKINVEVVYALPDKQYVFSIKVVEGTNVGQAIRGCPLLEKFPNLNLDKVGIFYKIVPLDRILSNGDRIEIYRPLIIDPKERRRNLAKKSTKSDI